MMRPGGAVGAGVSGKLTVKWHEGSNWRSPFPSTACAGGEVGGALLPAVVVTWAMAGLAAVLGLASPKVCWSAPGSLLLQLPVVRQAGVNGCLVLHLASCTC